MLNQDKTFFFLIVREDSYDEMYPVYLSESYALAQSQMAMMQNAAGNATGERFHLRAFANGKPCPLENALALLPSIPEENSGTASSTSDAGCAYLVCSGITGRSYVPHHVCKNHALAQDVLKGLMQDDLDKMPCHPTSGSSRQYYPDGDTDFWVDSLSGQAGAKFFAILKFQAGHLVPWLDDASFWRTRAAARSTARPRRSRHRMTAAAAVPAVPARIADWSSDSTETPLNSEKNMNIFLKIAILFSISCLLVLLALFITADVDLTDLLPKAFATLDMFNKIVGILIILGMVIMISQNYLEQRHKKTHWQELSDDAQLFLNTFASAHPDIQRAIFRILEIRRPSEAQATGDEDFGEFLQAYRQNRTKLREAAARVMTDDDKSAP